MSLGAAGAVSLNGLGSLATRAAASQTCASPYKISLAQWSLNRGLFGRVKPKIDNLDFAKIAHDLGIEGLEYVNQFFKDKAKDQGYLAEMKKRARDHDVESVLIMCDGEGNLGEPDKAKRIQAVENHYKWLEAAKFLGCHSIRVNAHSKGTFEEQQKLVADGLGRLCRRAAQYDLNVIVENHGGLSSNGKWLAGVMKQVNLPNCGTLPDFGNFREYDRYLGVEELMPYAKGVSAKTTGFDDEGNDPSTDYYRMMRIVRDTGYQGYVGIESSLGGRMNEIDAIKATKRLLEKVFAQQARTKPIFNGKDLAGWTKIAGGDWTIENGTLIGRNGQKWTTDPQKTGSWLCYDKPVRDFRLELQYAINERANSGVFFRAATEKNPAFTGYEMQITSYGGTSLNKGGTPGAIYGVIAPSKNTARPAGQWNSVTIIGKGSKITIEMNGEKVVETELNRSAQGHIGLQNHDERSVIRFRNIRLETL